MAINLGRVIVTIDNECKRDIKELTRKIGKLTQEIKKLQELLEKLFIQPEISKELVDYLSPFKSEGSLNDPK